MWKVFLAFVSHRLLLLMVAFFALQSTGGAGTVADRFFDRVSEGPEAQQVQMLAHQPIGTVVTQTRNPLHWAAIFLSKVSGADVVACLLVLSNLLLLLFLWELYLLFSRMVTTDIATSGAIFALLWPTSYELSLGSSMTLACFFVVFSLRQAMEQQWWFAGPAAGLLALMDPVGLFLLPAYLYLFWSVQRFMPSSQWSRSLAIFIVPVVVGAFLSGRSPSDWLTLFDQSALLNLFQMQGAPGKALFSHSMAGQTISLIFFFLGAAGALFSNVNPMHRFFPFFVLFGLVCSTPFASLASRAPLAAVCMEGIASASSGMAARIVGTLMVLLGAYEVYSVFAS